ncbi:conserved hypothetical protein [Leishmania infantum JPCM5]|uniref:Uncharacterized protein n=2 Tax=Leishmania infantum TaxID=5671 RepID=A4I5H5_LEIIN|nr:conserved hypothetical protein [Leishmania infantum JPCM5]CAC9513412.1 hypothetical_protein_-_conserved [Leishmania infantum]CAM70044.1 conserved hypothetical protein [Leishmania infantum JPCM5]SUZ43965.1 hypothetical_protein_-_conserved [Leishmania infantum]|eukprot:XP_001466994.1 conserved hypothetical protein [Leishmania infantum JPCM5]
MQRLVCVPSYYGLTASGRALMRPSHSLLAYADSGACRTRRAVRHHDSACDSSTANKDHEAVHLSHTRCQQRIGSFDRRPLLPPPLTPCSIGGTPFAYLLQRIIVGKAEELSHMRREALEFLCNVAVGDSTTRRHGNATEEAKTRERRMREALLKVEQPALCSSLQQKENPRLTVCLQRPEGHVCVPAVVGETYLFLRSQGVDVTAWWERYYTAFIRPSTVEHPSSEGMIATAAADARGVKRVAASPVTADCSPDAEWNGATPPPPLYWKLDRGLRHTFSTYATASHRGDVFAVPLPSFEEPAPCWVAPAKTQTDASERGSDGVPASTSATAAALASPPTRQSVWIPVWLIRHLPFFPIPFPSANAEGEPRRGRSAEMRYNDAAFASADSPLTSHDPDSCMTEENERVLLQRDGEPETTEADCLLSRQDAVSRTNASDDAPLELNGAGMRACTSWHTAQTFTSTPRLPTHAQQDQLDKEWGHPFFDGLHSVSDIGNWSPRHATLTTSSGNHGTVAHDIISVQALWHQRVRESSTFALDLEFSTGCPPTTATTTTGALSGAATAEWPSPLFSWKLRSTHWRTLSSFWATKADPASSLAADYSFPLDAYPLLRYRSFLRARAGHTAISTCKPHLHPFSEGSILNRLEKDTTSQKWIRYPFRPCGAAQQRTHWNAQPPAHSWIGEEGPLDRMPPTAAAGDAPYTSKVSVAAQRASVFHVLLRKSCVERVAFFGVHYVSVDATALSCLFDSTVCVRHAVPLGVTGAVFKAGLQSTRYRQQHSCLPDGQQRMLTVEDDQSGAYAATHRFSNRRTEPRLPLFAAAMKKLEAAEAAAAAPVNPQDKAAATPGRGGELGSTAGAAPWLARLRAIRNERERGKCEPQASPMERVVKMRTSHRSVFFLFQSPYWVEVAELYERWGVRVAPGTVPLLICGKPYVNAEQTTDASRFSPNTCVPHLMQEVLFSKGLEACTWAGSQCLLSLIAPGAAPRPRPGGACAWTYRTLCERAAAVQRVSNLWIAESVIERFKWTLRTAPAPPRPDMSDSSGLGGPEGGRDEVLRAVLPLHDIESSKFQETLRDELHSEVLHRHFHERIDSPQHADSCKNTATSTPRSTSQNTPTRVAFFTPSRPPPPPCEPPVVEGVPFPSLSRRTAQPHVCVVHSSCVAEQAELTFVAAFSPVVLLLRVPDLTSRDWGFDTWEAAKRRAATASRTVETRVTGSVNDGDGVGSRAGARAERPLSSYKDLDVEVGDEDDQAFDASLADDGASAAGSGALLEKRARLMYMKAMRRKRLLYAAPWRSTRLSFESRLDLSHLALRKGYSAENANRWVSLDFLRDEPRVRAARTDMVAPKVDTQGVGEPQIPRPNFASDPAVAASSAERQAKTSSRSRSITGIRVDVLFYSQDEPGGSSGLSANGGYIEYDHGMCSHDNCATDDCSGVTRVMKIALVNYEELEWPESVVSSSKQQWVWKNL